MTAVLYQIFNIVHSMSSFKLSSKTAKLATETEGGEEKEGGARLNIRWILFKLRKAVNVEVAKAPTSMNIVSNSVSYILPVGY